MRYAPLVTLGLFAFVIGCGGNAEDAARPQGDAAASGTTTTNEAAATTETVAPPAGQPVPDR